MRYGAAPFLLCSALYVASAAGVRAQAFPAAPSEAEAGEARAAIARMKGAERGPYLRIRWYCADGSVHPPQGTPCATLGGGIQHAEHAPEALRLAEMGYDVGTILAGLDYGDFADEARAGYRLREIVLERHLFEVDDGWVLRRARYYRGALQAEDEEAAGRALLERRLSDRAWTRANFLLASRLAASVPHAAAGGAGSLDRIRALAVEVAELDEAFTPLRVRIHSAPSAADIAAVQAHMDRRAQSPEAQAKLTELRDELRRYYDPSRALASLALYRRRLAPLLADELASLETALRQGDPAAVFDRLVQVAPRVRESAEMEASGAARLDLLDLGLSLQERALALAAELEGRAPVRSRREALARLRGYVDLAYAGGYLSGRERAALRDEVERLSGLDDVGALEYKSSLAYLGRSLDWGRAEVRATFVPVLDRYVPVEPRAAGLPDALVRASALLPLSRVLDALHADADERLGAAHRILGEALPRGARGLNPGVAVRTLRFLQPGEWDAVERDVIYVLPETPADLKPVAGVLTLDEGNLLSHVQLLARNLGIPNATLSREAAERLREADGRQVFYAVSPRGRVVIEWPADLGPTERALVPEGPAAVERYRLDTSRLRLDAVDPIPLEALRATHSGVVVGPKAANLGQLAADFPGRVSSAVALPFGMFYRHADRPWAGSEGTVLEEVRAAYRRADELRAQGADHEVVDAHMFERLAWVREAIQGLEWIPELSAAVVAALDEALDGDLSRGVFVRSDTNVEDLPQFSGAGLNLTVAHQTTAEDVLAAVKRVWTSPFSERAYLWRREILAEQGDIYPSVLLQESIASEKSGVLITTGLEGGGPEDLTVVVAEGVGGAVDGEDAETLLVGRSGGVRLLSQAKAPRRRALVPGGTRWVAAEHPDTLLAPNEIAQLLDVVARWEAGLMGTPQASIVWDSEFGFVDGQLWLFQIRPFIRFRNSDVYGRLEALDATSLANAGRRVSLTGAPGGS